MNGRYLTGEIVDITIKGARIAGHHRPNADPGILEIIPQGTKEPVYIPLPADGIEVERVAPPAWPPLPGDLWTDREGRPWFAFDVADHDEVEPVRVLFQGPSVHDFGSHKDPDEVNQRYGPMSLTHRPRASCSGWLGCECTHGADCKVHPLVGGPHSFDSKCCKGTGWSWTDGASVPCEDPNCPVPAEHRYGTAGTR